MKLRNYLFLGFVLILSSIGMAGIQEADADKLLGTWEPGDSRSKIKIEKIGSKYFGKIVWLKEPNDPATKQPKLDKNNPDTALRNNPLKGNRILKDFIYVGKKEWGSGSIYDPKNGKTYKCVINMKDDNTIDIRGYIGIKAIGRTDTWKRVILK
ncbi:MAG: DUF2147 domain-containing protein [bacterium]|nr:DUF2147 domain-containing protein [bacterium]